MQPAHQTPPLSSSLGAGQHRHQSQNLLVSFPASSRSGDSLLFQTSLLMPKISSQLEWRLTVLLQASMTRRPERKQKLRIKTPLQQQQQQNLINQQLDLNQQPP